MRSIVDAYGLVEAGFHGQDAAFNDFLYYCFTKSCRTLNAILVLLDVGLREDALVLVRTAYENYLATAYLLRNPESVDELVRKPLGLRMGEYEHPANAKGRVDRRRIVDRHTGQVESFGLSIARMAEGTKHKGDSDVHECLYPFLSECTHAAMIAVGNYVDTTEYARFAYEAPRRSPYAAFLALYVYTISLVEVTYCQELDSSECSQLRCALRFAGRCLTAIAAHFDRCGQSSPMLERCMERLSYVIPDQCVDHRHVAWQPFCERGVWHSKLPNKPLQPPGFAGG